MKNRLFLLFVTVAAALALSGCGYNRFQTLDEQTKSAWSEVLNQYQRRADLVPTRTIGSTDLSVWVAGTGHARYVGLPAGRRDIQIRHRDGTVWRRRITARVIDGSEERLALDSALGATVQPADLVISWLVPCRLGSDAVELLWWTTDIAECQLAYAGTTDDL